MNQVSDMFYSYLPNIKAYIPDYILSQIENLPDVSGYGFIIAIILLLPILRTLTYTIIQPLGTVTNTLAGVLSLSIRTFFQIFSTISIAFLNITISWINAINNFLLLRSNYFILVISITAVAFATCFYLEQKVDLNIVCISVGLTSILYAIYKYKLAYSYNS